MVGREIGRKARQERGAAATEFAIIAPLFFMLIMGLITGGLALDGKNTLTSAAREAARFGATLATESTTGMPDDWFEEIATVATQTAAGQLANGVEGRMVCVAYVGYRPSRASSTDWTRKRVETSTGVTYTNGSVGTPSSWCFDDGRGTGGERRVQVLVERDTYLNAVLVHMTFKLTADATGRYEPVTS
ncbi:MAG TPA: TadE/TadG family type IV pilus assembly protein [Actinomycetota bacterium]|jgi:Flp pilus assembly protein TadG